MTDEDVTVSEEPTNTEPEEPAPKPRRTRKPPKQETVNTSHKGGRFYVNGNLVDANGNRIG